MFDMELSSPQIVAGGRRPTTFAVPGGPFPLPVFQIKIRNSSMQYRNAFNAALSLHLWFRGVQRLPRVDGASGGSRIALSINPGHQHCCLSL